MKNTNIEFMKFIAAIGVVLIHTGNFFKVIGGELDFLYYVQTYTLRFAVPLFLMYSGYFYCSSSRRKQHIKTNATYYILMNFLYDVITALGVLLGLANFRMLKVFWYFKVLAISQIVTYRINKVGALIVTLGLIGYRIWPQAEITGNYTFLVYGLAFMLGFLYKQYDLNQKIRFPLLNLLLALMLITINVSITHSSQGAMFMLLIALLLFSASLVINYQIKYYPVYSKSLSIYLYHMLFLSFLRYFCLNIFQIEILLNSATIVILAAINVYISLVIGKYVQPIINKIVV